MRLDRRGDPPGRPGPIRRTPARSSRWPLARRDDAGLGRRRWPGQALGRRREPRAGEPRRARGRVSCLAFSPDGKTLATGGKDRTVRLGTWPSASRWRFSRATGGGHGPGLPPRREDVVLGKHRRLHPVLDVAARKSRRTGSTTPSRSGLAVSPDGMTLASIGGDRTIKLWDAETDDRTTLSGQGPPAWCIAFHPDGKTLVSGGGDKSAHIWDVSSGKPVGSLPIGGDLLAIAFSGDGKTLALSSSTARSPRPVPGIVTLWDGATRQPKARFRGHLGKVWSLAFAPDGATLASSGEDRSLRLWDVKTNSQRIAVQGRMAPGSEASAFMIQLDPVEGLAVSPTARRSPRSAPTPPSRCGTHHPDRPGSSCKANRGRSAPWPSPRRQDPGLGGGQARDALGPCSGAPGPRSRGTSARSRPWPSRPTARRSPRRVATRP
ncbi:MAG: WD40 repeat domain-containing protein [Singulisphaera sp.]